MRSPRTSTMSPAHSSACCCAESRGAARSAAWSCTTIALEVGAAAADETTKITRMAAQTQTRTRPMLLLLLRDAFVGRLGFRGDFGAAVIAADERFGDEAAVGRRRRDDHLDLVGELVGERFLDEQRVARDQRAFAAHLLGVRLAHALE